MKLREEWNQTGCGLRGWASWSDESVANMTGRNEKLVRRRKLWAVKQKEKENNNGQKKQRSGAKKKNCSAGLHLH